MSTRIRLAVFAGAAGVVFGLAMMAGHLIGPDFEPMAAHHAGTHGMAIGAEIPGGLAGEQDGYRLTLDSTSVPAGRSAIRFVITGSDGLPVRSYDVRHDKQLHLIAVRRDFTGFQHVHPTMADGVWSTSLALTPGVWRLFADFKPTGRDALTLGTDLMVPGAFDPAPVAAESRTAVVDGYRVAVSGELAAGKASALTLSVSTPSGEISDLDPYLGSYGHLVVLRAGDLAYLHVHPSGTPGDGRTPAGPDVVFDTEVPSAGTYHLYFDFKHRGVVRTAAFIVTVPTGDAKVQESGSRHASSFHR